MNGVTMNGRNVAWGGGGDIDENVAWDDTVVENVAWGGDGDENVVWLGDGDGTE